MKDIRKVLEENNVILKGHFLLSSGLHSDTYFEKFRILEKPRLLKELLSEKTQELSRLNPTLCIGPLTGGALVAFCLADLLGIKAFYMEKEGEELVLKRDFQITPSDRILLCDDVLTTGGSFRKMLKNLKAFENQIVGYFVIIDRSEERIPFLNPLISVLKVQAETFHPENCPLCKQGIPLEKRGSGKSPIP